MENFERRAIYIGYSSKFGIWKKGCPKAENRPAPENRSCCMRALCAQTGSEKRVGRRFFGVRRPRRKSAFRGRSFDPGRGPDGRRGRVEGCLRTSWATRGRRVGDVPGKVSGRIRGEVRVDGKRRRGGVGARPVRASDERRRSGACLRHPTCLSGSDGPHTGAD